MKLHRFYCDLKISGNKILLDNAEQARQIKKVLRLSKGDKLIVFSNKTPDYLCQIEDFSEKTCHLGIIEIVEKQNSATPDVCLYCSVLKKENFELVVQKATELGVAKIVPIICERTVKTGLNIDRLHKIAIEAIEQSGQSQVPEILEPILFEDAVRQASGKGLNILLNMAPEKLANLSLSAGYISLFVGPEGGWTEAEITKMGEAHFVTASICKSVLRAETAAIAGLGAVVSRF